MKSYFKSILVVSLIVISAKLALAQNIINFDDITVDNSIYFFTPVPTNYDGITWVDNFLLKSEVFAVATYNEFATPCSSPNYAYNVAGTDNLWFSFPYPVAFNGAWFAKPYAAQDPAS